jgi:protein TonB
MRDHLVRVVVSAENQEQVDTTVQQAVRNLRFDPDWGTNPPIDLGLAKAGKPQRVRVSQGVAQALLERKVDPKYPAEARKNHIQGIVVLHALIDRDGKIAALWVASGAPELAPATLAAVSQWRFRPYLLNNEPIQVDTQITVNYTLSGK